MSSNNLQESIRIQREKLTGLLHEPMHQLAHQCSKLISSHPDLEQLLTKALPTLPYCKHLFVLDAYGIQKTDNVTNKGLDHSYFGRDRMKRPYMQGILGTTDFKLSEAYISRNKKRPSLTAVQVIRDKTSERVGFLGADFDLRELPYTELSYKEPDNWRQIKGDPAIRSGLFFQQRIESIMDQRMDQIIPIMNELMTEHGVFHGKLHFSSNRATLWLVDDPFTYRILSIDEITAPDICLAYPRRPYHHRAIVPADEIYSVFEMFHKLRLADENVYLRAGSLNTINGMVGLNFSCDGSHYMRYDEFLSKSTDFWFGTIAAATNKISQATDTTA